MNAPLVEFTQGRRIFEEEHNLFRDAVRTFVEREIVPYHEQWEKDGKVSRDVWLKAGEAGLLCMDVPEEYGGVGIKDFRYNLIVNEELIRVGAHGPGFTLQSNITCPYILNYGTEEQKKRWLPKMVSGEIISAIAMTEPGTGSDLQGIKTRAVRNGDHYVVTGQKTFITNGILNNLCIVVAKTGDTDGYESMSLIVVEEGMEGYEHGRNLEKIGMHAQDTAELFFNDVKVPAENLLGGEGQGFICLMQQLPQERLSIAADAIAAAEVVLGHTIAYCKERTAFGKPIGSFQNSKFKLAEMKTEVEIGRVFIDHCTILHNEGELTTDKASMAKWWATDLQKRVTDECLQLHGGYGYMMEYPVARAFVDGRITTIFGGANEIMKEIIGRSLGF